MTCQGGKAKARSVSSSVGFCCKVACVVVLSLFLPLYQEPPQSIYYDIKQNIVPGGGGSTLEKVFRLNNQEGWGGGEGDTGQTPV